MTSLDAITAITAFRDVVPRQESSNVYDFYGRGVNTAAEIKTYLSTWFNPVGAEGDSFTVDGHTYVQIAGFRRMDTIHGAFVDVETGKHAFALNAKYEAPFLQLYDSYAALLDGVTDLYCSLWHCEPQ